MRLRIVSRDTPEEEPEPPFLGHTVRKVSDEPGALGYRLTSPEGKPLRLIRYVANHRMMYALNQKGQKTNIKGHYYFTDERGTLEIRP